MVEVVAKVMEYMDVITLIVSSVVAFITLIISSVVAFFLAKHFGDVAGTKAAIEFEKDKAAKARVAALQSLLNEVERIRKLAKHNSDSKPKVKMPTAAFEAAFVSGTSGLAVSPDLLNAVTDYLVCADRINMSVDIYVSETPSAGGSSRGRMDDASQDIRELCSDTLRGILDQLSYALQRELE
jgi:hypothetical protein